MELFAPILVSALGLLDADLRRAGAADGTYPARAAAPVHDKREERLAQTQRASRSRPELFHLLRPRQPSPVEKSASPLHIHSVGVDPIRRLAAFPAKRRRMEGVMVPLPLDRARTLLCELSERFHVCREYQVHMAARDQSRVWRDETAEQEARDVEMLAFYERWIAVLEGRAQV
jgi:hypothetical protein